MAHSYAVVLPRQFSNTARTRPGGEGREGCLVCWVLEVCDAARHARHVALSLSPYHSDEGFGITFWIGILAERKTDGPEGK